jgi:hypothetical protein
MVTPLENTQTPLFTSPHPLSAPLAIAAPAQQEQLVPPRARRKRSGRSVSVRSAYNKLRRWRDRCGKNK